MGMPLLWLSVLFLLGMAFERFVSLNWWAWLVLSVLFLVIARFDREARERINLWKKLRAHLPIALGLLLAFFSLGGLRYALASQTKWHSDDLAWYNNQGTFMISGWVSAPPERRENMNIYEINSVEIANTSTGELFSIKGRAKVYTAAYTDWQYGDLLQFTALPQAPGELGDFSFHDYLATFKIHTVIYYPQHVEKLADGYGSVLRRGLIELREKAWKSIFSTFPQPESGLLAGILLGIDSDLPSDLAQDYRDTGMTHIIAISGFNMAVLATLCLWFFTRLCGPYWAALLSGLLLILYTLFVDGAPSVVRALIMAIMATGGHLIGRRQAGFNALALTGAAMGLINPLLITNISFQLSFAATFGLVGLAQPMQDSLQSLFEKRLGEKAAARWTRPLSEYFLFTLAAQIATLPIIALHFKRISLSSLLANPLVLPVQPPLLVLGGITTVFGMLHPLLGKILMLLSWPLLKYSNWMVSLLANIQGAALTIHSTTAVWIGILVALSLLTFFLRNYFKKLFGSKTFVWILLGLGCITATLWSMWWHKPDGRLHLRLLPCGDKVTLTLTSPGGETLLINPSGDMNELTSSLERDLSPWDFDVDAVLLTNRRSATELASLTDRIKIQRVFLAPGIYQQISGEKPIQLPEGLQVIKLLAGQIITVEPGLSIGLLSKNNQDTALGLEYGTLKVLIPNGVDVAEIKAADPNAAQRISVLVLGKDDVDYIPLRVWRAFNPLAVLWASQSLSPFVESFGLDAQEQVHLVSDGSQIWIDP